MAVVFPYAKNFTIEDHEFIAAWIVWFREHGAEDEDWTTGILLCLASAESLAGRIKAGATFSLDVLCRSLVPSGYRNTMQATPQFCEGVLHLLDQTKDINPKTGQHVNAVKIKPEAVIAWMELDHATRCRALQKAVALLTDDVLIELSSESADDGCPEVLIFDEVEPCLTPSMEMPIVNEHPSIDWRYAEFIRALVDAVAEEPFQPMMRRRPVGESVTGWGPRLMRYFWPTPRVDYAETETALRPIREIAQILAGPVLLGEPWSDEEERIAVDWANDVFAWGRVRQAAFTARMVRQVFENALTGELLHPAAPMNSGWTKIAAFASECLEAQTNKVPQVIWDSRVATSIIRRLDYLLSQAGLSEIPDFFNGLGLVPGRGGTRARRQDSLKLRWPLGYGKWSAQFAGSRLVKALRDHLNREGTHGKMPLPNGNSAPWTIRGVEMVLFGDGC
jgi:hypothetical protein